MKLAHYLPAFLLFSAVLGAAAEVKKPATPPVKFSVEQLKFFEDRVRPIFVNNCFTCHGDAKQTSGLRLDKLPAVLKGGSRGPAVVKGDPAKSVLLKAVQHADETLRMPPGRKLSEAQIADLVQWVKLGAPMPADAHEVSANAAKHWAYQPVSRPAIPKVKNSAWVRNPIDAFVLAKLEAKGLAPTAPADRVALIRRATYDLTGLPPAPAEVDQFVKDTSPQAYEALLDRLLESPHYGEKWGRSWLDVVRYAESNGYERDGPKPFAWRFRDYAIKAFNEDKPFDRFVREQLGGDELPDGGNDGIIATGYYRLGIWDDEPVDGKQARVDELDDFVTTTGQVFLAMTLNCARCHDHKIDPIPQADYYRFMAFFQDVHYYSDTRDVRSPFNLTDISPPEVRVTYEAEMKRRETRRAELTAAMKVIEDAAIQRMPREEQIAAAANDRPAVIQRMLKKHLTADEDQQYTTLKRDLDELNRRREPARELALSVNRCEVPPRPSFILIRGNAHNQGPRVEPGFPKALNFPDPPLPAIEPGAKSSGRRSVLANWLVSPENPLTARVFVNRLWHYHFGRGIVGTPNDFGKYGEAPSHPELLDWLARDFMVGGWRIKRMHKLIMMSNTYKQSSRGNEKALKLDPANWLLWRYSMRRLTAEEVRDSFLSVSGELNLKAGGPPIYPKIPKEVLHGQSKPGEYWFTSTREEAARRSVYVHVKRALQVPVLSQHDMSDTDNSCPVRYVTVVPTQALGLLNGEFANEQATAFAERLRREAGTEVGAQIRLALRLTTCREPEAKELQADVTFVRELQAKRSLTEAEALRLYCLLALNANEFVYLD